MSGKPKLMSQIKQLLRLYQQGQSKKFIVRSLGLSKTTVNAYLAKIASSSLSIDALLDMEDPALEAKLHAGNPAYKEIRFDELKSRFEYYVRELKRTGVDRRLLWEEYRLTNPGGYSYSQFCFHLSQQLIAARPSMVLQHQAGEKLFIDFAGKKLSYIDPGTGEVIYCHVFVACLPFSDYGFAMAVRSQGVADFIYALQLCMHHLGGSPQVLVPDNLKSAIVKANPYEPDVNQALQDFANHYQMTVLPARVRKPKDKALVENHVQLVYSRVYARLRNQTFFDLATLNEAIREKMRKHNQTRMQQKPYCREERFLAFEKNVLRALPEQPFELKYYKELKVAKNNHIYLSEDKHYYSVPFTFIGSKARIIYTRSLVHIYAKGEQIALHVRSFSLGGYSTSKEHLCSHHQHYLDRSPEYYLQKAQKSSESLSRLVQLIFQQDRYPEQLYRTCDGLLRLHGKSNPESFEKACLLAIEHQNYSYRFILNVLENKMTDQIPSVNLNRTLPEHQNIVSIL